MIKSSIVSSIKARLGNRTDTNLDTLIDSELDIAQWNGEHLGDFTPWFLLSEDSTASTSANESRIPEPTDFLAAYEEGALWYVDADDLDNELEKNDLDKLRALYRDVSAGEPEAYAHVGTQFILFPEPDDAYTLKIVYYQSDTLPSDTADGGENLWMKHAATYLLNSAGAKVAAYIKDAEAAAMFASEAQTALEQLYKRHVVMAEANRTRYVRD